jgi:epoxyqueuosine reductase QueG
MKEKFDIIEKYLENIGYKTKVCVDNNSLSERDLACKAGLGYIGLNGNLINDEYGSYIFLGVLLTDALIEEDNPLDKTCLMCMSCVLECPTHAIKENGEINGNECLSYLTQKKELTEVEYGYLNKCIYGCDICQKVCPLNSNLKTNTNFIPYGIEFINVKNYKSLSNKEFNDIYGNLSGSWRRKKIIERNINAYRKTLENVNK